MDNAGFELFCDMIYADFFIMSGIASEVRFHGKRFAWFVSDVTAPDFSWIINQMIRECRHASENRVSSLTAYPVCRRSPLPDGVRGQHCLFAPARPPLAVVRQGEEMDLRATSLLDHVSRASFPKQESVVSDIACCSGWTYWDLKNECPDLWLHLCDSDLVIFKG